MTDTLPTVWHADAHTLAKHAVLERFLKAWFPILSHQSASLRDSTRKVLYVDGFAGPGEYEGGELGSPLIALNVALNHRLPRPVHFVFIELRRDRYQRLLRVIGRQKARIQASTNVVLEPPRLGSCDEVLPAILDDYDRRGTPFGPALAFFDQFGYSAVSMSLITRIMRYPQCEIFTYLDYRDMNRWITDPDKHPAFTRTYGGEEWREAIELPEGKRRSFLLEKYKDALRNKGGVQYVQSFSMSDKDGRLLYWLLFCTNHLRGLEEMKRAMWTVDSYGTFRFSDKENPAQFMLLDAFSQNWLADTLATQLDNQSMTVAEVKAFVLEQTPCYQFKIALKNLLRTARLTIVRKPPGYKSGFADDMVIRFGRTSLF
jgi:three-Cys-motif partner protein